MQTAVKVIVFALVLVGIFAWAVMTIWSAPKPPSGEQLVATVAETQDTDYFLKEGVLMVYRASDTPTYYLLYEGSNGQFLRKELRFTEARGCSAQSGDLPCVFRDDPNSPPVSIGSYVRVEGLHDAQRVVVDRIGVIDELPETYRRVHVRAGEVVELPELSIAVLSVTEAGGCKVFSGCFDEGTPRVTFEHDAGIRDGEKTFVPGMFMDIAGGNLLLLWADVEQEEAVFVIAQARNE